MIYLSVSLSVYFPLFIFSLYFLKFATNSMENLYFCCTSAIFGTCFDLLLDFLFTPFVYRTPRRKYKLQNLVQNLLVGKPHYAPMILLSLGIR